MLDLLLAWENRGALQDAVIVILCLVAIFQGGGPERAAIAIWVLCFEAPSLIYREWMGSGVRLAGFDPFLAAKDFVAGALWVTVALYANRNYTLWIAGTQLLAIGAHLARGLIESVSPTGFLFLVVAPGWFQLVFMSIGFTRHILRKRKYGSYRDWRMVRKPLDFDALAEGVGLDAAVEVESSPKREDKS